MIHRVLLVEGSSVVVQQYKDSLASLNLEIVVEKDGYLALGRLLKENFDSLLVSSHVSSIDGASLITILKMLKSSNRDIITTLIFNCRSFTLRTKF